MYGKLKNILEHRIYVYIIHIYIRVFCAVYDGDTSVCLTTQGFGHIIKSVLALC